MAEFLAMRELRGNKGADTPEGCIMVVRPDGWQWSEAEKEEFYWFYIEDDPNYIPPGGTEPVPELTWAHLRDRLVDRSPQWQVDIKEVKKRMSGQLKAQLSRLFNTVNQRQRAYEDMGNRIKDWRVGKTVTPQEEADIETLYRTRNRSGLTPRTVHVDKLTNGAPRGQIHAQATILDNKDQDAKADQQTAAFTITSADLIDRSL